MADVFLPNITADGEAHNTATDVKTLTCDLSNDCIRDGHIFYAFHSYINVDKDATVEFTLNMCPPAVDVLLLNNVFTSSAGPISVKIKEDVTIDTAGTPVTIFNRNRNSSETTCIEASYGDVVTGGTIVSEYIAGSSGNVVTQFGGSVSRENPVVMKNNSIYSYTLTNNATVAQDILIKIEFRNGEFSV